MANTEHVAIVKKGKDAIEKWRAENPGVRLDLSGADLQHTKLSDADLTDTDLTGVNLSKANLASADLRKANLRKADLRGADLTNAYLSGSEMEKAGFKLTKNWLTDLSESNLTRTNLNGAELRFVDFNGADLREAILTRASLGMANMTDTDLSGAQLRNADLTGTKLVRADLRGADLSSANLNEANLLGIKINSTTSLNKISQVFECKMNKYAFEYLKSQSENLNVGRIMDMDIHDDLATLKSKFGSFWGVIHFFSIIVFLMPYLWFLLSIRPLAEFNANVVAIPSDVQKTIATSDSSQNNSENIQQSITILTALGRYIWSGGVDWNGECKFNEFSFFAFLFFLTYNLLRLTLLWKTKKLETQENVTDLPVQFSINEKCFDPKTRLNQWIKSGHNLMIEEIELEKIWKNKIYPVLRIPLEIIHFIAFPIRWKNLLSIFDIGIYLYIFFVFYNSYHFLQMEIVI